MNWKIIILLLALIAVGGYFILNWPDIFPGPSSGKNIFLETVTVDSIADGVIRDADYELSVLTGGNEGIIVGNDNQTLIDFGQSYNENDIAVLPVAGFCMNLGELSATIGQKISVNEGKLITKMNERSQQVSESRSVRDKNIIDNRADWDAKRELRFTKLGDSATTDTQRSAVEAFKTAVIDAVTARRVSFDAAKLAFDGGIDKVVETKDVKIDAARSAYKDTEQAAMKRAEADCALKRNETTIRNALVASLKAGRVRIQSDIAAIEKLAELIQPLVDARAAALQKTQDVFRMSIETARTDLKGVLPS